MIVKNKEGEQGQGGSKKEQKKKSVKIAERAEEPQVTLFFWVEETLVWPNREVSCQDVHLRYYFQEVEPEEDLDEQIRMENLKKLSMGKVRESNDSFHLLSMHQSITQPNLTFLRTQKTPIQISRRNRAF